MSRIITIVAAAFGITPEDIRSKTKKAHIVVPRHIAMLFSREYTDFALQVIASEFNRKEHATVFHAVESITAHIKNDAALRAKVGLIRATIVSESAAITRKDNTRLNRLRPALASRLEFGRIGRLKPILNGV